MESPTFLVVDSQTICAVDVGDVCESVTVMDIILEHPVADAVSTEAT